MVEYMITILFGGVCFKGLANMRSLISCLKTIFWKNFFLRTLMLGQLFFLLLFYGTSALAYYDEGSDYRDRYPILMRKVEQIVDIPLLAGRGEIKYPIHDTIRGFLEKYKNDSASVLFLLIPSPTVSSASIRRAVKDIRKIIISSGIPVSSISERIYDADYGMDVDTIRLSYFASKPSAGKCGFWPEDMLGNAKGNRNWTNYGCAYQNNLAAQVVNPLDLFSPRMVTPPDAEQRDKSIQRYRQ